MRLTSGVCVCVCHLSREGSAVHVPLHEVGGVALVVPTDQLVGVVHARTVHRVPAVCVYDGGKVYVHVWV